MTYQLPTHRRDRPWWKITFNPDLPGTAKVVQRRNRVPGQWVAFDRNLYGPDHHWYDPVIREFCSGDINECHAFIDRAEARWEAMENAERFSS